MLYQPSKVLDINLLDYIEKINSLCEKIYENAEGIEIITLCGSVKFKKLYDFINLELSSEGFCVFSCASFGDDDLQGLIESYQKEVLDQVHKSKINHSQAIVVINPGNYIGESTRSEINFAEKLMETRIFKIFYLEEN